MRSVKLFLVGAIIAATVVSVCAAPEFSWKAVTTDHYRLLFPAGAGNPDEIVRSVAKIWDQTIDLWVPESLKGAIPVLDKTSVEGPPEVVEEYLANYRPLLIAIYPDWEALGWDFRPQFGVFGLLANTSSMSNCISRMVHRPKEFLNESDHPGKIWMDWVVGVSGTGDDDWKGALVHELTHYVQLEMALKTIEPPSEAEEPPPENIKGFPGLDTTLWVDGTATWAEHALGYADAQEDLCPAAAAIYLKNGGSLEKVPMLLRYDVGYTLVEALAKLIPPTQISVLLAPIYLPIREVDFNERFSRFTGEMWRDFLRKWEEELSSIEITQGDRVYYEFIRRGYPVRFRFLSPLLTAAQRDEFLGIWDRVTAGHGTPADLDCLEGLFSSLTAEPTDELLEALYPREEGLSHWTYAEYGAQAQADVARLSILRIGQKAEYIREFVRIVNTYFVSKSAPVVLP